MFDWVKEDDNQVTKLGLGFCRIGRAHFGGIPRGRGDSDKRKHAILISTAFEAPEINQNGCDCCVAGDVCFCRFVTFRYLKLRTFRKLYVCF